MNRTLRAIAVATMGAALLSLSACEGSGEKKDQRKRPQSFADVKKNLEISEKLRDERKAKIAEIEKDASKNEAEKLDEIYRLEALNNAITIVFYGGYVVDAFVDLNTGYSVSLAELDRLTITNPSNGKGMTLDLMEEQYKFEDPWAMAREAASRAEKELGAVPAPPPLDRLALATKHERMIGPYAEADAWLTDAAKAYQEKDMNSVKRYAERALKTVGVKAVDLAIEVDLQRFQVSGFVTVLAMEDRDGVGCGGRGHAHTVTFFILNVLAKIQLDFLVRNCAFCEVRVRLERFFRKELAFCIEFHDAVGDFVKLLLLIGVRDFLAIDRRMPLE